MPSLPTIAALSSGWCASPWGLVRVSGAGVPELVGRLVEPSPLPARRIVRAGFRLTGGGRVPCWAMFGQGPRTYTGEDSLELLLPGNPIVLERVLARLCERVDGLVSAAREAAPGEFSARAFLNGKMTLEQAEGIAAAIAAQDARQLAAAAALAEGVTGRRYREWSDRTATLLALVEAGIDFTDQEDVVPIAPKELHARLDALATEFEGVLGARSGAERLTLEPRAVLAGEPNAGKSTLFNALLGRRRAVESPIAGTTRDVLAEPLDLSRDIAGGPIVTLVDLAGLDEAVPSGSGPHAGGTPDQQAQHAARRAIESADIIVHCDPTGRFAGWVGRVGPMRSGDDGGQRTVLRVRTKADLPGKTPQEPTDSISVCALDGWNLNALRRAIADAAWGIGPEGIAGGCVAGGGWLLPRHRRALADAHDRLRAAIGLINPGQRALIAPEVVAGELRAALDSVGELTGGGAISPDEIIGRVFATFCVGK